MIAVSFLYVPVIGRHLQGIVATF